jgi:hypothetical protein
VGVLLAAGGCASAPAGTAELAPVRLHSTQTGAQERCGLELIREVQRANDLTWSERILHTWTARREAQEAMQDEEQWRQRCIERYRKGGYEVVTAPAAR